MITDKVRSHHLERKALLYVRQSSPHQVLHNRESSALQYAMQDRLTALGWSEIEVTRYPAIKMTNTSRCCCWRIPRTDNRSAALLPTAFRRGGRGGR